ncbi:AAA family ATPase [Telluribacter humicola]|uniref:AAA family ATPase n=1 Tax=Telluribacter humicola TaxID=1720261 RepID=UPI001A971186|nr:ATP-binding protein [Telluribacter humicola]
MIKLNRIAISNFKNIRLADVTFRDINVLVGPNGSGKSNFMRVLSFVHYLVTGPSESVTSMLIDGFKARFGLLLPNDLIVDESASLRIDIDFMDTKSNTLYFYSIELHKAKISGSDKGKSRMELNIGRESFFFKKRSMKGAPAKIFTRELDKVTFNADLKRVVSLNKVSKYTSALKILELFSNELLDDKDLYDKYIKAQGAIISLLNTDVYYLSSHALRFNDYDPKYDFEHRLVNFDLVDSIIKIGDTDKWGYFKEVLKSIANIDDVAIRSSGDENEKKYLVFRIHGKIEMIFSLSDGMLLIIALITKILTNDNCIIFIEEPENSIHPKALQDLMQFIRASSITKQFLISTHSVTLLNLTKPEEVFVSHIDADGMAEIEAIRNIKELKQKLNRNFLSFGDILLHNMDETEEMKDLF